MDPKELTNMLLGIANAFPLSEMQKYEVIGRFVAGLGNGKSIVAKAPIIAAAPIAPTTIEAPEELPPGKVMIPANNECLCTVCSAVIYKTKVAITENMKKKDFVAAFAPQDDAPELPMPLDTWADPYGNLAINCPVCNGEKTLWIRGQGIAYSDVPEINAPDLGREK